MNLQKTRHPIKAFTLIELMIVVAIIGILASIGIPTFQNYLYKAKLSDAYLTLGAIQKFQIVHFQQNGEFYRDFHLGLNSSAAIEPGGSKYPIRGLAAEGLIIPQDSMHYFSFASISGFYDGSGDPQWPSDTSGSWLRNNSNFPAQIGAWKVGTDFTCPTLALDANDLGIQGLANEHWSLSFASGHLKGGSMCTHVINVTQVYGGQISTSPFLTID